MKSIGQRFFSSTIFRSAVSVSCAFIALQVGIIIFISVYSQNMLARQADTNTRYILGLCEDAAEIETASADKALRYILTQDAYLRLLASPRDNVSYHASYEINSIIERSTFYDVLGKTYVLANAEGRILLEKRDGQFSYARLESLRPILARIGSSAEDSDSGWHLLRIDDSRYLTRHYICEGVTVMALLDVGAMWKGLLEEGRLLRVSDGGDAFGIDPKGAIQAIGPAEEARTVSLSLNGLPLTLAMNNPPDSRMDDSLMPALIVLSSLLTLLFVVALVIYLYRDYNRPIAELEAVTRSIEQGDFQSRAELSGKNRELRNLAASFNSMLDMILQLRIEQYEHIIRRQDVELKYYYMQIRPHFYLNALSSMQSMCLRGENQRVSEYIIALSKNIRYMFNAGFQRVPLREEMEHIDDYIRCQEILMPGCVFSYIDVTPEAGNWMVPQMSVHTFVENVYKHVVSPDKMVTLLVRAEVVPDPAGAGKVLCVIVEDDGEGFSGEILAAFASGETEAEPLRNCVGLMNVRRTLSLMYGREDLLHLQNNGSAGSKIRMYIPPEAVSERRESA